MDKEYAEALNYLIVVERSPVSRQAVTVSKDLYDDLKIGVYVKVYFYENFLGQSWMSVEASWKTIRETFHLNDVIYVFQDEEYSFQGFNGSQIVIGYSDGDSVYVDLPTFRFELKGKIFDVLAWDKDGNSLTLEFWPWED